MITRSDVSPPLPGPAHIAAFERHFEPDFLEKLEDQLRTTSNAHVGAASKVKQLRAKATADRALGSKIAKDILKVRETCLITIFSALLFAGLEHWCPDIMSPHDTPYNQVHELIFVETFNATAIAYGYRFLAPTPSGVNNHAMVKSVFHSYAYNYMRNKARIEAAEPGKLSQNKEDNNNVRRRTRVCLELIFLRS